MRKLHIIPIVHSRQDLGSLDGPVHDFKSKILSDVALRSSRNVIENFWHALRIGIESWQVEFNQFMLYQDALPHTGHPDRIIELRIVSDLSAKGSPNHQLLEWLMQRGANLVGTESTELLLKEYEAVRKSLAEGLRGFEDDSDTELYHSSLLSQRDQFIADRISTTLQENHLGLLFIGMLHRVEDYLDGSIAVEHPFGRPKSLSKA